MKTRVTITLDGHDAELLEHAVRLAGQKTDADASERRWVLRWFIRAASAAVIRDGEMPCPLAVELRHETWDETETRIRASQADGTLAGLPPANIVRLPAGGVMIAGILEAAATLNDEQRALFIEELRQAVALLEALASPPPASPRRSSPQPPPDLWQRN
ncbi:MAG: hypothetical protein HY043_07610 [Verrucomicrobia bacterium]|nr:hypothetical protein [Verrucomicrobiota bacterium]